MIIYGWYDRTRCVDEGTFDCPICGKARRFKFFRTYRYHHLYFIPLIKNRLLTDYVLCSSCGTHHSVAVLGCNSRFIPTPAEASRDAGESVTNQFGNILTLSPEAAAEIRRRREASGYKDDTAIRISPEDTFQRICRVSFDFAQADGRDWIGESQGLAILVDRQDAPFLHGAQIQFRNGNFRW